MDENVAVKSNAQAPLVNATILITYRESSAERRQNLMTTVKWLAQEAPGAKLLVVEQDDRPRLNSALPHPNVQVMFCVNPHGFNKAWGFNVGVRRASTPVLVFTDADLLVPGRVQGMLDSCTPQTPVVKPHEGMRDLSVAESERVHQGHLDVSGTGREDKGEHLPVCGGMFAIRADLLMHVGAWDERFVGWGGEDDAMSVKLQRARAPVVQQPGPAWHLWHPRAADQRDEACYRNNLALLAHTRGCSDAQLVRMAEVQRQTMGHVEKYSLLRA